jgi:hypothetical protein
MYPVDDLDRVIELKDVPQSSVGAPVPIVLSDEYSVLLGYLVENTPLDCDDSYLHVVGSDTSDEALALVEFTAYRSFSFGSPNDEAFHGHPLAGRGLHPYGAFQVQYSSWIRQLERMNSVHHSHSPERFERLKHFVFAFHDSTFECVAEGFTVTEHEGSLESLLPLIWSRLQR